MGELLARPERRLRLDVRTTLAVAILAGVVVFAFSTIWESDAAATALLVAATVAHAGFTVMLVRAGQN